MRVTTFLLFFCFGYSFCAVDASNQNLDIYASEFLSNIANYAKLGADQQEAYLNALKTPLMKFFDLLSDFNATELYYFHLLIIADSDFEKSEERIIKIKSMYEPLKEKTEIALQLLKRIKDIEKKKKTLRNL